MKTRFAGGLLFLAALMTGPVVAAEPIDSSHAQRDDASEILWYDLQLLDIEGRGWKETKAPYDRLPAKAEGVVRDAVWSLSRHSAGECARFVTDATTIHARWTLTSDRLDMPHMPATGVSGLDLYVKDDDGTWQWLAIGRPTAKTNSVELISGIPAGTREYLLYLPLYNGVSSVELGLPEDATLSKAPPRKSGADKPIVFYGTSITQGGCASRTGMVHTALLGRWLDRPVINLGFSGNGRMEPEVGTLMTEIDAAVYVVDCLPNLQPEQVAERTEPLVMLLRNAHPETPILLVEDRNYSNAFLVTAKRERNKNNQTELQSAYERLKAAGVEHLYYLPGDNLLGDDNLGTVDSSHPTDLGFFRQAQVFEKALRPILKVEE